MWSFAPTFFANENFIEIRTLSSTNQEEEIWTHSYQCFGGLLNETQQVWHDKDPPGSRVVGARLGLAMLTSPRGGNILEWD